MKPSLKFIFLLATLSGAAALSHELLWTRRLVDLLGATGEATARVFGCFFLGLSLGGLIAAYLLPRVKRPWFAIAYCELAIAALAVPALFLPAWTDWIWPAIGTESLAGWQGSLIKTLLSGAVVLPPAIPMGMTLPFFVATAAERHSATARVGVWIYGVNTLGGVIGLLTASTVLLEELGVAGCMATAIGVNLLVGVAAMVIGRASGDVSDSAPTRSRAMRRREERNQKSIVQIEPLDFRLSIALAFFSGLATLMLELLAIQMISLIVPSSFQATAAVLASVILVLAISAIATPILLRFSLTPRKWLLIAFAGSILFTCLAPQILFARSRQLVDVLHLATLSGGHLETTMEFLFAVCSVAFVAVGPALLMGGMVFPTILASTASNDKGVADGRRFGWLLAANGLGGIIGAELTNLMVLPTWGIYQGFAVVGVLYALGAGLVLAPRQSTSQPALRVIAALIAISVPVFWGARYLNRIPYLSPRTKVPFKIHETEFGRDGALLVVESPTNGKGILLNNQYMLGSSAGEEDERRQVLIPMLLHPNPEQVCCVGLATGISAGAAVDYPRDCQVQVVELSTLVADAAKKYFADHNNHLFDQDNIEVVIEDGRTFIAAARNKFDVVVGDLYRPYGAGEGRLFSVEHFQAARDALRDGGMYCQWLPMYQLTESHFKIIAATFLEAFPDARIIRANDKADYPMLALVGWKGEPKDFGHVTSVCADLKTAGRVDDALMLDADALLGLRVGALDSRHFKDVPLNTLDNARIEIDAGRRKITQNPRTRKSGDDEQEPYLVGNAWIEFDKRFSEYLK